MIPAHQMSTQELRATIRDMAAKLVNSAPGSVTEACCLSVLPDYIAVMLRRPAPELMIALETMQPMGRRQ